MRNTTKSLLIAFSILLLGVLSGKAISIAKSKISIDVTVAQAALDEAGVLDNEVVALRREITANPDVFLELSRDNVVTILDEPDFIFTDRPTQVWQFRHDSCVLDLYFNLKDAVRLNVVHFETRSTDHTVDPTQVRKAHSTKTCVRNLFYQKQSVQDI